MGKINIICDNCGLEFQKYESKIGKHNFCCRECYSQYHSKDTPICICEICGKEFKGSKGNANRFCSRACYDKFHGIKNKERVCPTCGKIFVAIQSEDKYCSQDCHLKQLHEYLKGENHPNWQGGKSKLNDKRDSNDYKKWRLAVYKRDGYKCCFCGSKIRLNAHHIKSWKNYPELRYNLDNGITLCEKCHIKLHQTIGYDNSKIQKKG